jgi:DNA-binding NarL/FixJ family response regulator
MIRILIVDDHDAVQRGLARFLATIPDVEIVGTARTGAHAVRLAEELEPDVILMDLRMPDMDGIEATRRILDQRPGAHVVVLTSFPDKRRIGRAMAAGAGDWLLKDAEPDEVATAIRRASEGSPQPAV